MKRRTAAGLMCIACALHAWAIHQSSPPMSPPPGFDTTPLSVSHEMRDPVMAEQFISPSLDGISVHAASICELSDGSLGAVWYAGSREGAKDVSINFSTRPMSPDGRWSEPRVLVNRASASEELDRFVRKVGNPVLFASPDQRLWLVYVTVSVGGWAGSSLNVKSSHDAGQSWSRSIRLTLSPFFNVSELVRNRPIPLRGAGVAVPIYHECLGRFPELLWMATDASGSNIEWRKTRMAGGRDFIQPSIVPMGEQTAVAFYRNMSGRGCVAMAKSTDSGSTWSEPRCLNLPNPNSGLQALPLPGGRLLLAFNDSRHDRSNLRLAVSSDGGIHWTRIATLEDQDGEEFSYPFLIRDQKGQTHLVYTWKRKRVKHIVLNDAWIEDRLTEVGGQEPGVM